jgi:hypothetical protein
VPYFVYKIDAHPIRLLEKLSSFEKFPQASADAKKRRVELNLTEHQIVKVIFAESELEAEDLLSQVREAPPTTGEDY